MNSIARMQFEHEDLNDDEEEQDLLRKRSITFGFSAMLDSIVNNERSHVGYARLEPAENQGIKRDRIILDPHTPLTWTTKHYVQRPTPYDALKGLSHPERDGMAMLPKAIEDKTSGRGLGNDSTDDKKKNDAEKSKDSKGEEETNNKFVGIFLAAISGLFFTLCSVMVKLLPHIDPSEVLLFRAIVQFALTIPIMLFAKANPLGPKDCRLMVYFQGVVGCLTVTCIFIGFARLPVGDAATIIFCSPIFVMVFSHIILREHCGIFRLFVICLLMLGVVLIAKPPFLNRLLFGNDNTVQAQRQNHDMIGYGAALAGTLLTASNFVCMRRLRHVHFSVLIFAFSVMSGIMSAAIVPLLSEYKLPRTSEEWSYAVLVGVFGLLGQSLLAVALKFESAGVVSVTRSMDIAVAYIIQIVWFGDIPLWTSILGALVVIMAVFTMSMEDAFLSLLKNTFGSSGWC